MVKKIKYSPYQIYVFLLLVTWNRETIFQYIKSIVWRIPYISYGTNLFVFTLFLFLTLGAWSYMKTRIKFFDIFLYLTFVFIYIISILIEIDSSDYLINNMYTILIQIVPTYFIGLCINDNDIKMFKLLHITSIISIYMHLISTLFLDISVSQMNDAMDFAYRIQPHVLMVGYFYLKEKKKIDLISLLIGMLSLIWFGSRGAFILTILYLIFFDLFFNKHRYNFLYYSLVFISIFIVSMNSIKFFICIRNILMSFGIKTRIFDRIIEQTFFSSVGRNVIKDELYGSLSQKPFFGFGIAGDRPICYKVQEVYAHNLFLELFVSYGLIIGAILLFLIFTILFKALYLSNKTRIGDFILILIFSSGFLKLFLSSSYLLEYEFFFLLGICVSVIRKKRYKKCNLNYIKGVSNE